MATNRYNAVPRYRQYRYRYIRSVSTSSGRTKYVENVGRTDDDVDTSQRHKSQQPSNGFSMRHFRQCN